MSTPVRASDQDLRALVGIVSADRPDLAAEGLPPSLLADLMGQIRCDALTLDGWDSGRQTCWFSQHNPAGIGYAAFDQVFWENYWDCQPCSYAARTGDLRSVIKTADFYSARQWHSTGMHSDYYRPLGLEHSLMLCLPRALPPTAGPGQYVRLTLNRGPGPDFSERDRAVLALLGPHLDQAYLDAERRRHPVPRLTPRQTDLLRLLAAGHTNTQIARRLGISEATVRTHLEHIYDRLQVSSRTAAVTRAFPDRAA
ncbi:MAG TPA: response regulator transcription factor [Streptosporangiaceae bacterium]|jgi:DNA-binding CsgD family transcriptional regulator|nr:response regulator transcription factor [Streptosporangiaceae bacterium]